jgi:hypothetical protein
MLVRIVRNYGMIWISNWPWFTISFVALYYDLDKCTLHQMCVKRVCLDNGLVLRIERIVRLYTHFKLPFRRHPPIYLVDRWAPDKWLLEVIRPEPIMGLVLYSETAVQILSHSAPETKREQEGERAGDPSLVYIHLSLVASRKWWD